MEKHSKRYRSAIKVADLTKQYPLQEAVEILAKFPKAKFDETVELSFRLGVDAEVAAQQGPGLGRGVVGQGLATIVRTHGHSLVFDAGPQYSPEADGGNRVIVPFLRGEGVSRIDALVLSHDEIINSRIHCLFLL